MSFHIIKGEGMDLMIDSIRHERRETETSRSSQFGRRRRSSGVSLHQYDASKMNRRRYSLMIPQGGKSGIWTVNENAPTIESVVQETWRGRASMSVISHENIDPFDKDRRERNRRRLIPKKYLQ